VSEILYALHSVPWPAAVLVWGVSQLIWLSYRIFVTVLNGWVGGTLMHRSEHDRSVAWLEAENRALKEENQRLTDQQAETAAELRRTTAKLIEALAARRDAEP
jgi:hypothetical protein